MCVCVCVCVCVEGGGSGLGYQKWPKEISPSVNLILPYTKSFGEGGGITPTTTKNPNPEGDIRTTRTAWCTARAPRLGFYQPFPAFFTFFQGGKDAVA